MKIKTQRIAFDRSAKWLRRARHLFVLFFAKGKVSTTIDLNHIASAMLDAGLYSQGGPSRTHALRECRYRILRKLWRFDGGFYSNKPDPMDWHQWCYRNGWACHTWENKKVA